MLSCNEHLWVSVVPINLLIEDLTISTSNFDDQTQFLKTNFFSDYLLMIKRHYFCFSYLCLIKDILSEYQHNRV